jgi:hypothetical protein
LLIPIISRLGGKMSSFARGILIVLVGLNIYSLTNYFFKYEYRKDDFRAAANYVTSHSGPDIASVIVWGPQRLLAYYGDSKTLNAIHARGDSFAGEIDQMTESARTVLVIVNNEFHWKKKEKTTVKKAMSELYTLDSSVYFANIVVYRFNRREAPATG